MEPFVALSSSVYVVAFMLTGRRQIRPLDPTHRHVSIISAAMLATVAHARRSSMSNELLLIWLVVGAIAGWLAGTIVKGGGFGLLGDIVIGIIGAFVGGWLLTQLGVTIGTGIVSVIATATIGAVALLALLRVVRFA